MSHLNLLVWIVIIVIAPVICFQYNYTKEEFMFKTSNNDLLLLKKNRLGFQVAQFKPDMIDYSMKSVDDTDLEASGTPLLINDTICFFGSSQSKSCFENGLRRDYKLKGVGLPELKEAEWVYLPKSNLVVTVGGYEGDTWNSYLYKIEINFSSMIFTVSKIKLDWSSIGDLRGIVGHSLFYFDKKLLLIGGWDTKGWNDRILSWMDSKDTKEFKLESTGPKAIFHDSYEQSNQLIVVGGLTFTNGEVSYNNQLKVYSKNMTLLASKVLDQYSFYHNHGVIIDQKYYTFSGINAFNNTVNQKLFIYDPNSLNLSIITSYNIGSSGSYISLSPSNTMIKSDSHESSTDWPLILGISIGAVITLSIIFALVYYIIKRNKNGINNPLFDNNKGFRFHKDMNIAHNVNFLPELPKVYANSGSLSKKKSLGITVKAPEILYAPRNKAYHSTLSSVDFNEYPSTLFKK